MFVFFYTISFKSMLKQGFVKDYLDTMSIRMHVSVCDSGAFITLEKRFELYDSNTIPFQKTLFECFNLFVSNLQNLFVTPD